MKEVDALLRANRIKVNGSFASKGSQLVLRSDSIEIEAKSKRYVSRGGDKLEHALSVFGLSPKSKKCIDIGSSTGGFTDCLLQHGAKHVTCIDVGYGLLHEKIKSNNKVEEFERLNIRDHQKVLGERKFEFVVADLSFISLKTVMTELLELSQEESPIIFLVKPQYEATRREASKNKGIIKDSSIWLRTLEEVAQSAEEVGAYLQDATASPILGRSGNKEFLLYFARNYTRKQVIFSALF